MVKTQSVRSGIVLMMSSFLLVMGFGMLSNAATGLEDIPGLLGAYAEAEESAATNTTDVTRAEEKKEQLVADPGNAAATRELAQINQGIEKRSQQTYGAADRFNGDRKMQQLATKVASSAQDWPHVQAYADRWAALEKPNSPEWAKAVNTGGLAAHKAGDYTKAEASALKVLKQFPKDKEALSLYHASKGRGKGVTAPAAPIPSQTAATAPASAPNPYNDPRYKELGARLARVNALNADAAGKLRMGDANEALRLLLSAQAIEPTGKSYILEARAWVVLDKLADAIDRMGKAIDLLKKNGAAPDAVADAYGERAKLNNMTKDAKAAISDANAALIIDPRHAASLRERGLAYESEGDLAAAEADLRRAAEFDPSMGSDVEDFYKRKANGFSGAVVVKEEEGAVSKAWKKLVNRAGGVFKLLVGVMGALFVLFATGVFFFTKESSPMRKMSTYLTPWSDSAATVAADSDMPRAIDSQFELRRVLGEGGMGKVYEGWDSKLNRPVAIKCLRAELQTSPRERERFVKEARTVALLQHPHIVQIFTIVEEAKQTYIVYEHIDGKTLHEAMSELPGRRVDPRRALEFLRQIAGAVDHAHERKIIHRDLKPANVMMTSVGGKDWLKVMDFGIARQVQDALGQTNTNTIVGTPIYMAPEQSVGLVTKQSDVYALGITLYEMLTGGLPFKNKADPMERWNEGAVHPASQVLPTLPSAIDAVIAKALAPKHENRYQSCMEFYEAAENALGQVTPT